LILIKRKQYKIYSECGNDECNAAKPGQPNTLRVAVWVGTVRAYPDLTVSNKINTSRFTSELGQSRPNWAVRTMSGLPPV